MSGDDSPVLTTGGGAVEEDEGKSQSVEVDSDGISSDSRRSNETPFLYVGSFLQRSTYVKRRIPMPKQEVINILYDIIPNRTQGFVDHRSGDGAFLNSTRKT